MRELIPDVELGTCEISSLPTHYKYNGFFMHESFLTAANKLCMQYPENDFDKALEIILSAQIYRKSVGEENMTPEKLKELDNLEPIWKMKLKKFFKKSQNS